MLIKNDCNGRLALKMQPYVWLDTYVFVCYISSSDVHMICSEPTVLPASSVSAACNESQHICVYSWVMMIEGSILSS